jgi:hypothetical protein
LIAATAPDIFLKVERHYSMTNRIRRAFLLVFAFGLLVSARAQAQGYTVEVTNDAPPESLSAAVRDTLASKGLRVTTPSGPLCEIWLRKAVPGGTASQELGVVYPQLQTGTLVGAMVLNADTKDYRRAVVHSGVYTLRYALSPVNGNHQGVAPQRDFLVAIPADVDKDPAALNENQTIEASKKSTSTNHPSVWSLVPGEGNASAKPVMTQDTGADLWIVQFSVPIAAGGAPAPVRMGLVVVGFGPEV